MHNPATVPIGTVGEWRFHTEQAFPNPFADVVLDAELTSPTGARHTMPGFYAGEGDWCVRFNPDEPGRWTIRLLAAPATATFGGPVTFEATEGPGRRTLRSTPGKGWGHSYPSGESPFLLGDTTYNLFGMAHCGADVDDFLERRAAQGFNLLRVRVPVSPFHPPRGYSHWQTRRTWPWGGSEQKPQLDRFDLDYFASVDRVVCRAEALGVGLEVIMEAWGFEAPFAQRDLFLPEWEELWLRYLIARYDAYNCVYFWTLMNEYEYYPDGDWRYNPVADRWALRMARWVKAIAPHGHIVAVHNGPRLPAFADRFQLDPEAIDAIMFQDWGARDREWGWLATGIEDVIRTALAGWRGSAVFAEWGYERNPEFPLNVPGHEFCDREHTRRGAWRGAFCGLGIIHGFENSWGPFLKLDEDQPGLSDLLQVRRFFTEVVSFADLLPVDDVVVPSDWEPGMAPLALASLDRRVVAIYLPVGGDVELVPAIDVSRSAVWFDPITGETCAALPRGVCLSAPEGDWAGHPKDWVLVVRAD